MTTPSTLHQPPTHRPVVAGPVTSIDDPRIPAGLREQVLASTGKWWWWDRTLNPFRGCTPVSAGCANCWALRDIERRLSRQIAGAYSEHVGPTFAPRVLSELGKDRRPKRYFCPSVSDPHHEAFTDEMRFTYYQVIFAAARHYTFSLTSRADGLARVGPHLDWPDHVLAVVSVEDESTLPRIERLHESGAKRRGVSFEPVIGRVPLRSDYGRDLVRGLDYAIVGGETADEGDIRPMRLEWAREIVEVCLEEGVPVFFKQVGDVDFDGQYVGRKRAGRTLDGRTYDALPRGCLDHLVRAWAVEAACRDRRSR